MLRFAGLILLFAWLGGVSMAFGGPPARLRLIPQLGHVSTVRSLAFSPDGKLLATGDDVKTAKLWDVASGREVRSFAGHSREVYSVAFSPDGKTLASGSGDGTAKLWDVASGREIRTFSGHVSLVESVAFSPDGKSLATGSLYEAKLWNVASGHEIKTLRGHAGWFDSVAFSPDGKIIASGSDDKTAKLWDVATGREMRTLAGHADQINSVVFSSDGKFLATGSHDKTAKLWDVATGREMRTLVGHRAVLSVSFSPDGKVIATGSSVGSTKLWDIASGSRIQTLGGEFDGTSSVAFSPDGKLIATGNLNGTAGKLWDVASGREIRSLAGHAGSINSVAFSPDGKCLVTGSDDKTAKLWDVATGREMRTLAGHAGRINSVVLSPDGKVLVTGSWDGTSKLWNVASGREFRTLSGHTDGIFSVAFSPDGQVLATGSKDRSAKLWDVASGREVRSLLGHAASIFSVAFSPDGRFLVTGSYDGTTKLWDVTNGREIRTLTGPFGGAWSAAFSPDGTVLATCNDYTEVALWDVANGREPRRLVGHRAVLSVSFSADGKLLATGSWDQTAKLWDAASGRQIRTLSGHEARVSSVRFSPDGKSLVTGSSDGTTRLWDTQTGRELCSLISFDDGTWAVVSPDGRYDAPNGGDVAGLCWVLDGTTTPIDLAQFKDDYYEPGLLSKLMGFSKEPLRKIKPLDQIDIKLPPEAKIDWHGGKALVTLTDQGGGIGPTEVFVQNKLVFTDPAPVGNPNSHRFTVDSADPRIRSVLVPGSALGKDEQNEIRVVGHTFDRQARPDRPDYLASRSVSANVPTPELTAEAPRAFVLAVGASDYAGTKLDLKFAAKDAIDFSREVSRAAETWLGKERVFTTLLASDGEHPECKPATRDNILGALDAIAKQAKSTDILVAYFSGHGVSAGSGDRDYYYVAADADSATPGTALFGTTTISGEILSQKLIAINAKKQMIVLDTCASGEFGAREGGSDIRRSWERMKDKTGVFILAGCSADSVSYESTRYNQGLLTYSLLEAMKANDAVWQQDPALGPNPFLDVQKWLQAAESAVPRLVAESQISGVQQPEFKSGKNARGFWVGALTPEARKAIQLARPLPILLPAQTVRNEGDANDEDTLGLREKLNALLNAKSSRGRGTGFALWRTEAQPGAYRFNVRYKVGPTVVATVSLLRYPEDPKAKPGLVETFTVSGAADGLAEAILEAVMKRLK